MANEFLDALTDEFTQDLDGILSDDLRELQRLRGRVTGSMDSTLGGSQGTLDLARGALAREMDAVLNGGLAADDLARQEIELILTEEIERSKTEEDVLEREIFRQEPNGGGGGGFGSCTHSQFLEPQFAQGCVTPVWDDAAQKWILQTLDTRYCTPDEMFPPGTPITVQAEAGDVTFQTPPNEWPVGTSRLWSPAIQAIAPPQYVECQWEQNFEYHPPDRPPGQRIGSTGPPIERGRPGIPPPPPPPPPPGGTQQPPPGGIQPPREDCPPVDPCYPRPPVLVGSYSGRDDPLAVPFWARVRCDDACSGTAECWQGDCPPDYDPAWEYFGPFAACPNLKQLIRWCLGGGDGDGEPPDTQRPDRPGFVREPPRIPPHDPPVPPPPEQCPPPAAIRPILTVEQYVPPCLTLEQWSGRVARRLARYQSIDEVDEDQDKEQSAFSAPATDL